MPRPPPILLAALASLLTLGSLWVGLRLDDYFGRWVVCGCPANRDVALNPIDAYCFADGDQRRNERMKDIGLLPWWSNNHLKAAFWRPITVLTQMLDYSLWPNQPSLMHAQSIFWFALMIASAALLYRQVMGATLAATLAALLYALDHSHALAVAWLASRNGILAGLFGILAILTHIRARQEQSTLLNFLSPIFLAISLLSAEAGIGTVAYLVAFALTLDRSGWKRGLLQLWPHFLVVVAWRIAWSAQGYGVFAMEDLYIDPGTAPLTFAQTLLVRAPIALLGQWSGIPPEIHLGLSSRGVAIMWAAGLASTTAIVAVLYPLLRRSHITQFWALGMALATILICTTAPMNRQLIFVGLGAMGLMGQLFAAALRHHLPSITFVWWTARAAVIGALVLIHLILAPIALAITSRWPFGPDEVLATFHELPLVPEPSHDLVFVNHPWPMEMLDLLSARAVDGDPLPRRARVLAPASTAVNIERTDERTLVVRPERGFMCLPGSRLGCSRKQPFEVGQTIPAMNQTLAPPWMEATILEMTEDHRPAAVQFRFAVPLENESLQWLCWDDWRFREFHPPAIGQSVWLEASGLPF
jgi:hypothetical protein